MERIERAATDVLAGLRSGNPPMTATTRTASSSPAKCATCRDMRVVLWFDAGPMPCPDCRKELGELGPVDKTARTLDVPEHRPRRVLQEAVISEEVAGQETADTEDTGSGTPPHTADTRQ